MISKFSFVVTGKIYSTTFKKCMPFPGHGKQTSKMFYQHNKDPVIQDHYLIKRQLVYYKEINGIFILKNLRITPRQQYHNSLLREVDLKIFLPTCA